MRANFDKIIQRVGELRSRIAEPALLVHEAQEVLGATPSSCEVLVAFSDEGHAVATACCALGFPKRQLRVERASLLKPLEEGRGAVGWTWLGVEEALGLG